MKRVPFATGVFLMLLNLAFIPTAMAEGSEGDGQKGKVEVAAPQTSSSLEEAFKQAVESSAGKSDAADSREASD